MSKPTTDPEGEGLADDLIGDDPTPSDARRFDEEGNPIEAPRRRRKSETEPAPS